MCVDNEEVSVVGQLGGDRVINDACDRSAGFSRSLGFLSCRSFHAVSWLARVYITAVLPRAFLSFPPFRSRLSDAPSIKRNAKVES